MPTFKITDPDTGRTVRVTGDSPPTQQEIEQIFSRFQVTQETDRQTRLRELAEQQGPIQSALIAAGKGLTDVGRGLGLVEQADEVERQAFEALEEARPVATTVGEIVGQAAPFVAAGTPIGAAAGLGTRAALSAGLGATEGAVLARGQGGTTEESILAGGAGGVLAGGAEILLPRISRLGGQLIRRITGKPSTAPILDATGQPSIELRNALDKAGLTIDDLGAEARRLVESGDVSDPAAVVRREFLQDQGLIPTRAQVTREASDFQDQQELAKASGRVREALGQQERVLSSRFENAITETGGSANPSNSPVFDFIADRSINLDAAIGAAYKQARDLAPTDKIVRADNLAETLRKTAPFNQQTGGLTNSVKGILQERGVIDAKFKPVGKIDANTAEQIRIDINGLFDSTNPLGRAKIRDLKEALDTDVAKVFGDDVFADARSAKAQFEKDLNRAKVNKFDKRKKDIVRDILENKVNPDRFLDDAVLSRSIRSDDVKQLKDFVLMDQSESGIAAWNSLRAEAMQRIRDDAFNEVGGELALSRAGLQKALDRFGEKKLEVLFDPAERKFLGDMMKVAKLREPVRGTALGKGPSAQAVGALSDTVKRISLIGGVFDDISADVNGRLIISPPALRAPSQPSDLARAVPLAVPAAPALISQEQQ